MNVKILDTDKQVELVYLGEGNTVICYQDKNTKDIYKEFFPSRFLRSKKLVRGENGVVKPANNLKEDERKEIDEEFNKFLQMEEVPSAILKSYGKDNATMIVGQRLVDTSIGKMYFCPFTGGELLKNYIERDIRKTQDFSKRLKSVLSLQIKLLNDLEIYHKNGYVNFDIKEENLWCVNVDSGDHCAIRNLDFGSCLKLKDLKVIARKKDYSSVTLTETYYEADGVRNLIESNHIDGLKKLDLLACFRLGMVALYANGRKGYEKKILGCGMRARKEIDARILHDVFCSHAEKIGRREQLFLTYSVYRELNELYKALIDVEVNVDCKKMQSVLQKLLDLIDNRQTEQSFILRESVENAKRYIPELVSFDDLCLKTCNGENTCSLASINLSFLESELLLDVFADILCDGRLYCVDGGLKDAPILQLFKEMKEKKSPFRCVIYGDGGMGKSVSSRLLNARLLVENIPCVLYECRSLKRDDNFKKLAFAPKDTLLIIDAYDEFRFDDKRELKSITEEISNVLITTRGKVKEDKKSDFTNVLFPNCQPAQMLEFSDDKINSYLDKSGYDKLFVGCEILLKNTMFLTMLLECKGFSKEIRKTIRNEATFIQAYFYELYKSKKMDDRDNWKRNCDRHCRLIGERLIMDLYREFQKRTGSYKDADATCRYYFSKEVQNLDDLIFEIPNLKGIVEIDNHDRWKLYGLKTLKVSHWHYFEFFVSCYLRYLVKESKRFWWRQLDKENKPEHAKLLEFLFSYYNSTDDAKFYDDMKDIYLKSRGGGYIYESHSNTHIMKKALYLCAQTMGYDEVCGFIRYFEQNVDCRDKRTYVNSFYLGSCRGFVGRDDWEFQC